MSGYKTTVLSMKPKLFITFDGDAFDDQSRMYTAVPRYILDESGFENHGIMQDSGAVSGYSGYRAGMPSVVKLEQFQQYSCSFGYYGRRPAAPNVYEKAYVEVPHSATSLGFPEGKFTVMFVVRKDGIGQYRADNNTTLSATRPLIRKSGVFNLYMNYPWASNEQLCFAIPGGDVVTYNIPSDFHGQMQHITATWDVTRANNGDYLGVATLYVNGAAVATRTKNYYDAYPNLNTPTSLFIGGIPDTGTWHSDRNTENCQIDQVAVYDKALPMNTVGRMMRKTMSYRDMILAAKPYAYWECADAEDPNTNVLTNSVSSSQAAYLLGGTGLVSRGVPGPSQVPGGTAVQVANGGQIFIQNPNSFASPVVNIANDYTVEFWFSATATQIASIFAMNGTARPFNGINLTLNMRNNQFSAGSIQLQETEGDWITTTGNFNDGKEHHCAIVKRGNVLELWLDGSMRASKTIAKTSSGAPGTAAFFAVAPGRQATDGWASQIAFYGGAMQEGQITARANYRRIYKVRGQVTLRGIPYKANVRVYSHFNGQLITEIFSDPTGGDYLVELYDNRNVDLVVLNAQDPTIRYRVYGPVTPSEYEDLPT